MLNAMAALLPRSTSASSSSSTTATRRAPSTEKISTVGEKDSDTLVPSPRRLSIASTLDAGPANPLLKPTPARPRMKDLLAESLPEWRATAHQKATDECQKLIRQLLSIKEADTSFAEVTYTGAAAYDIQEMPFSGKQARICKTQTLLGRAAKQKIDLPIAEVEQLITRCWGDLVAFYAQAFKRAIRERPSNWHFIENFVQALEVSKEDKPEEVFKHFVKPLMTTLASRGDLESIDRATSFCNAYFDRIEVIGNSSVAIKNTKIFSRRA